MGFIHQFIVGEAHVILGDMIFFMVLKKTTQHWRLFFAIFFRLQESKLSANFPKLSHFLSHPTRLSSHDRQRQTMWHNRICWDDPN